MPSPIIVKDIPDLRYLLINRAAEKYLGVDREHDARQDRRAKSCRKPAPNRSKREDRKLIESGQIAFLDEHAIVTPGNGTRIVTTTRLPVMGADGKPQYLISVIHDLTERKRDEQRIAHMAHHDPLTDLPNRAAFNECIAATLELAAASGESFAVLCIDLDRFKAVNDVFGHAVGDALLREVARPAGAGLPRRLPRPRRRRRIPRHHADRAATGDRRGAGRKAHARRSTPISTSTALRCASG